MTGVESLKIKETNRLEALQIELLKINADLTENGKEYTIKSEAVNQISDGLHFNTYEDHRMAMAFAPLSLLGTIAFDDGSVVNKSYPDFWNGLEMLN